MRRLLSFLMCFALVTLSLSIAVASEGGGTGIKLEQRKDQLSMLDTELGDLEDSDYENDLNNPEDLDYENDLNDSEDLDYENDLNNPEDLDYENDLNDSEDLDYENGLNNPEDLDYESGLNNPEDLDYESGLNNSMNQDSQVQNENYEILFVGNFDEIDWDNVPLEAMVEYRLETEEYTIWSPLPTKASRSAFGGERELYSPHYIPDGMEVSSFPPGEPNNTRIIIGEDERKKITSCTQYPYSTMCFTKTTWQDGSVTGGSGTMVSRNCFVTAAHTVYDPKQAKSKYPKSMKITPGGTYANGEFGTHDILVIFVPYAYWSSADKGSPDPNYDYAVVSTQGLVGLKTGYMGLQAYPAVKTNSDLPIWVYGYPDDKMEGHLWSSPGIIKQSTGWIITHSADTVYGQSGGPIVDRNNPNSIIGIHSGQDSSFTNLNGGVDLYAHALDYIINAIDRVKDDY